MEESKDAFLARKKIAIAQLVEKAWPIMEQLANDPELDAAIQDRLAHIERGELWITPAMIKYAPLFMQLEMIRAQIERIRSTAWTASA